MSTSSLSSASTATSSSTTSSSVSSKIDGLVSGLDTTSIINAIMAQAALPQTNLKNQLATEQAKLAAYQAINTKMIARVSQGGQSIDQALAWAESELRNFARG